MHSIPASIGKYRVERELGRGASGTVYLAHDSFRNGDVAVKVLHTHLLADSAQAARYRRMLHNEAVLAGQLVHPHIVAMIDVDEQADPPYLVMEYINGKSLAEFTTPDALLPVYDVLNIIFKCCNALEYAKTQGLVHRDIKPANFLLQSDGEVKLTDFGTALVRDGKASEPSVLAGSPSYMSPEQIREEELTHLSDMFSLGIVLYELLTGHKPFHGESDFTTIFKISSEQPTAMRVLRPALPAALDAVVSQALAKKPQDRFQSWREFGEALVEINRSLPHLASRSMEAVRFQLLRELDFFTDFSDVAIWETLRLGNIHSLVAGGNLMVQGAMGKSFYILLEGSAVVIRNDSVLSTLSPGVSIGEIVYLQPEHNIRTATVRAQSNIIVMKIRGESLRKASSEVQACFDKAFIKMLVNRLLAANQQLAEWDSD